MTIQRVLQKELACFLIGIDRTYEERRTCGVEENGEIRMTMRGMLWGNNIIDELDSSGSKKEKKSGTGYLLFSSIDKTSNV